MCQCSEYDEGARKCRSGFPRIFPVCRGQDSDLIPYCMREEPPAHLTRDDGLPLGWPNRQAEGEEGTLADAYLIAAAPEMYETIYDMAKLIEKHGSLDGCSDTVLEALHSVMAKARGEEI